MRRFTKSVNVRFEPLVEERIDFILSKDSRCVKQNWSKSDLLRHWTRVGIKTWENNMRGRI